MKNKKVLFAIHTYSLEGAINIIKKYKREKKITMMITSSSLEKFLEKLKRSE